MQWHEIERNVDSERQFGVSTSRRERRMSSSLTEVLWMPHSLSSCNGSTTPFVLAP